MKKQIILFTLCLLAVLVSLSAVSATTITVEQGGTYSTIQAGYAAANDGDTIFIKNGTYNGTGNVDIDISKNINITGESQTGTIIDANHNDDIFYIDYNTYVTISSLTLRDGEADYYDDGGAIYNDGICTVNKVTFDSNNADGCCAGGAIWNGGIMTITDCTFTNNTVTVNDGGAIFNCGDMNVTGSTFINNTAYEEGGAIYNDGGTNMKVTGCIFDSNHASRYGGAIYSEDDITITGCNFNKNTATNRGGAIYTEGDLTVKYSRFVGNDAGGLGEDIYSEYSHLKSATLNWWGSNAGPAEGRVVIDDTSLVNTRLTYTPWLVMNILPADPSTINTGQTSKVTVNVYKDSNGIDHSADAAQFFSGPEVKFTTNLGNVGSKEVTVPWTLGMAFATLRGDEGAGTATVTAADGEIKSTTVTILQAPTVNAASNTVGMQETGLPIAGLILAILAVFGGLVSSRK